MGDPDCRRWIDLHISVRDPKRDRDINRVMNRESEMARQAKTSLGEGDSVRLRLKHQAAKVENRG